MQRKKSQWRPVCDVCYLFEATFFLRDFWYLGISTQLSPFWCVFAQITKQIHDDVELVTSEWFPWQLKYAYDIIE